MAGFQHPEMEVSMERCNFKRGIFRQTMFDCRSVPEKCLLIFDKRHALESLGWWEKSTRKRFSVSLLKQRVVLQRSKLRSHHDLRCRRWGQWHVENFVHGFVQGENSGISLTNRITNRHIPRFGRMISSRQNVVMECSESELPSWLVGWFNTLKVRPNHFLPLKSQTLCQFWMLSKPIEKTK